MADQVYTAPQVTVNEDTSTVANLGVSSALPPSRCALVGPGIGYQTFTEPVTLTSTTPVQLTKTGVDTTTVVVKSLAGAEYVVSTDYVVAETGAVAEEATTTVARTGGGAISSGAVVYVTYQYTDSSYYLPWSGGDFDTVQARYGRAINPTTGAIESPLSLAAKIVLEQGAPDVVIVPTKGSTPTSVTAAQIKTAYANLAARTDVDIVVPLPVGITGTDGSPGSSTTFATDLVTHCSQSAAQGLYRRGIIGFDTTATRTPGTIALACNSERAIVVDPQIMLFYNGFTASSVEVGSMYAAAALAGMLASMSPSEPLTRKALRGFAGIPSRIAVAMTPDAMNSTAASGVTVIEQMLDGPLVVRHGVTSKMTSVNTREISVIRGKDAHVKLLMRALSSAAFVGRGGDADTPIDIQGVVSGALNQCVSLDIIASWSNLVVRRATSDPTLIEVRYAYQPIYPVNRIEVGFVINTATGSLQEAA